MPVFWALLIRDLRFALYFGTDTLACVLFFVLCGSLFPLALGPSPDMLHHMGPGIIWVCALLASLLPLDRLFGAELEDGSLDLLMLSGLPPIGIAFVKICAHWLTTGLPVLLASLPLGLMFGLNAEEFPLLLGSLTLGSLTFSLLGSMVAALVLGARRGGVLLPLLALPLSTPALVFGTSASYAWQSGTEPAASLNLLGAFFLTTLPLCPVAASIGLKEACR